jgi:hypothetical protein
MLLACTFWQPMLHGERLYRDLLEINPPRIFWFNIPAAPSDGGEP